MRGFQVMVRNAGEVMVQCVIAQADRCPEFRPNAARHVYRIAQLAAAVERFPSALVSVSRKGSQCTLTKLTMLMTANQSGSV